MRLIELPRSELPKFAAMPEARQVDLYFLILGEGKDELYIGQPGKVGARLLEKGILTRDGNRFVFQRD